jgi:hypothetical protein
MTSYCSRLLAWVDTLEAYNPPDEEHGISMHDLEMICLKQNTSLLGSILDDYGVAESIDRTGQLREKQNIPIDKINDDFQRFFKEIILTVSFLRSKKTASEAGTKPSYRSERIRKIEALADKAKALSTLMRGLKTECSGWLGTTYLESRHSAGSPRGFSQTRRGIFPPPASNSTIYDLLSSFADDTLEEVELLKSSIKEDRKPGGKTKYDRELTKALGLSCQSNLGQEYPSLITLIISAATGNPGDISTTGKRLKRR